MRISRIFRKYSRVLLLVFMSLLLVVFLLGDVISRARYGYAARDLEIGKAFGEPVYLRQTHVAENDFELAWQLGTRTPPIVSRDPQERNLAMYLLLEEARRAGVWVGRDQIIESLQNVRGAGEALSAIRNRTGRSLNSIYDSVARVSATMVLAGYQFSAASGVSLPELEQLYRDRSQEARVLISVIDSTAFLSDIPEPGEQDLQAHFEECKDRDTEHTEQALVFGYRIPDRVQVEYLTVDPAAIQQRVRVREREARRYYEDNQEKYKKPVDEALPSAGEEDSQPQKIQMTYEEVEKQVREDCRAAKAIKESQKLVNEIHHEARLAWDTAPLGEDNVRQAPSDDAIVPFTELQAKFSSDYPVIYEKTELVTARQLRFEQGFGQSAAVIDRERVLTSTLAFRVEGLAADETEAPLEVLRINEPGPAVLETRTTEAAGDPTPYQAYVFRVIRVEPSGPPASLDDVREKVVENVKRSQAFKLAGEQARALAEQARRIGLQQAVAEAEDLKAMLLGNDESTADEPVASRPTTNPYTNMLEPFEPEQFVRRSRFIKNVGFASSLQEQVFALADQSGPDEADERRVVAVPLARNYKWTVAELLEVKPIYRGEFEMKRAELERQATWTQFRTFYNAWFDPENIRSRAGFVRAAAAEP